MGKKIKDKKEKKKSVKKIGYLKQVRNEMKKVIFPSGKEVFTYTLATIFIVLFLVLFFLALSMLLSYVKGAI